MRALPRYVFGVLCGVLANLRIAAVVLSLLMRGRGRQVRALTIGVVGILIGLMANVLTANAELTLLAEPVGAQIRPMVQMAAPFAGGALGLCGAAVALVAVREEGTRWLGVAGLILGLSPFPLGLILFLYALRHRHLVLLP